MSTLTTPAKRARLIALYLPQFHPIPENDRWWGKGFTEWTNVAKAKPLFRGHYQPHIPADLGFYDLRVPETRQAQADMARAYGIEGFCYYHYWFAGERLLERPFNEVLRSGEPDFPFCLAWANETWAGKWFGAPNQILKEQTYPGLQDFEAHFNWLLQAFTDHRYITVDGKPLIVIYRPKNLPEPRRVTDYWRQLADKTALKGLHIVGFTEDLAWNAEADGFDGGTSQQFYMMKYRQLKSPAANLRRKLHYHPRISLLISRIDSRPVDVYNYAEAAPHLVVRQPLPFEYYPCVIPNWDNTPRSGRKGVVLHNSTPELFRKHLQAGLTRVSSLPDEHRLLFIKSWNEWAEGNYLEPDQRFGRAYLEVVKEEVSGQVAALAGDE